MKLAVSSRRKNPSHRKAATKVCSRLRRGANPWIPLTRRDHIVGKWFGKLVALQARLRGPGGCPWDREQTHESLRKFLIEETYEVLDAMESSDPRKLSSELGDLLLQVVFHSILAEEAGRFTMSDVIESVHTKMVRRHPHVFGEAKAKTAADVLKNWEQLKAAERAKDHVATGKTAPSEDDASDSVLAGVPRSLPAVLEAYQLTRRASHIGFDWNNLAGILDKLEEEKGELESIVAASDAAIARESAAETGSNRGRERSATAEASKSARTAQRAAASTLAPSLEEEVGDLLFAAVNIARFLGVDPEIALKKANRKFKRRFEWMELAAAREGRRFADLPRPRMEELWNESKTNT
jgi:MazG family protein